MNIKEYYLGMSRLYIHQTILCSIVFAIVILPCLKKVHFFPGGLATMFIMIMMIYFFLRYLYFLYKSLHLPIPTASLDTKKMLMFIMPTPVSTYHWKLYDRSGICHFSLRKINTRKSKEKNIYGKGKLLGIVNHENNTYWTVINHKQSIKIFQDGNNRLVFSVFKLKKQLYRSLQGDDYYQIVKTGYTTIIKKNEHTIMTITRGIMPIHLQSIFYSSTPTISFDSKITDDERFFCFSIIFSG